MIHRPCCMQHSCDYMHATDTLKYIVSMISSIVYLIAALKEFHQECMHVMIGIIVLALMIFACDVL